MNTPTRDVWPFAANPHENWCCRLYIRAAPHLLFLASYAPLPPRREEQVISRGRVSNVAEKAGPGILRVCPLRFPSEMASAQGTH